MPRNGYYDPETLRMLAGVFDDAYSEAQRRLELTAVGAYALRKPLAKRILDAAENGERDPRRLKKLALASIEKYWMRNTA